ncbi:GGDEF-domain containing protein, partial [Burkholderia sola]
MHWLFMTEGVSRWAPERWCSPKPARWLASLLLCMTQGQVLATAQVAVASAQFADEGVWFAGWDALGPWGAG